MDCIHLSQYRTQGGIFWKCYGNDLPGFIKSKNFFTSWTTIIFFMRNLFHEVNSITFAKPFFVCVVKVRNKTFKFSSNIKVQCCYVFSSQVIVIVPTNDPEVKTRFDPLFLLGVKNRWHSNVKWQTHECLWSFYFIWIESHTRTAPAKVSMEMGISTEREKSYQHNSGISQNR